MKYYCEEKDLVIRQLDSGENGLSQAEAERRLAENGKNKLAAAKKDSILKQLLKQLADPMIIILLAAAAISGVLAVTQGESFTDVIIILFVVVVNAVLGVYQENKAEKAIEALQEMSAATSKVLRDGKIVTIHSEELVVGDVVLLEAGDAVPADGRIIENASLKIEEAALTGESVPVSKFIDIINLADGEGDVPLGDRTQYGLHGLYRCLRPRRDDSLRNRHGHRDGQDRRRSCAGFRRADALADKAHAAEQNTHMARSRHMRRHICRAASARRRNEL